MRVKIALLLMVVALVLGLIGLRQGAVAAAAAGSCTIDDFTAVVRQGPTRGMILAGKLRLRASRDGAVDGSVVSNDGAVLVNLVGQVNGHALYLTFDLGYSGRTRTRMFAVGTLSTAFPDCTGAMGGSLTGPQDGDLGDWSANGGLSDK
jgi:hypothetical protein